MKSRLYVPWYQLGLYSRYILCLKEYDFAENRKITDFKVKKNIMQYFIPAKKLFPKRDYLL